MLWMHRSESLESPRSRHSRKSARPTNCGSSVSWWMSASLHRYCLGCARSCSSVRKHLKSFASKPNWDVARRADADLRLLLEVWARYQPEQAETTASQKRLLSWPRAFQLLRRAMGGRARQKHSHREETRSPNSAAMSLYVVSLTHVCRPYRLLPRAGHRLQGLRTALFGAHGWAPDIPCLDPLGRDG